MGLGFFQIGTADQVNQGTAYYSELARGAAEDFSSETGYAERSFYVQYINKDNFINYLLGFTQGDTGGNLMRTLPDNHPDYPALWATNATGVGKGRQSMGPNGAISYDFFEITATYRSRDYALLTDQNTGAHEYNRYVSRTYVMSSQYLTVQGYMQWISRNGTSVYPPGNPNNTVPPKPLQVQPGKIVSQMQKTMTWHQVPVVGSNPYEVPNLTTISEAQGRVNTFTFDGHPPGSCLFLGIDPHITCPRVDQNVYYWEIAYQFGILNNGPSLVAGINGAPATDNYDAVAGWNYIYDGVYGRWDVPTSDGLAANLNEGTNRTYQYYDLNQLFVLTS
jgi:hypothetical protein